MKHHFFVLLSLLLSFALTSVAAGISSDPLYKSRPDLYRELMARGQITEGRAKEILSRKSWIRRPDLAEKIIFGDQARLKKFLNGQMKCEISYARLAQGKNLEGLDFLEKKTAKKYHVISMVPLYKGEGEGSGMVIPGIRGSLKVRHLSEEEREVYRVIIKNGDLFSPEGKRISSANGKFIYVMDRSGNFYISNEQSFGSFHHSSFFAGGPVSGAGELRLVNGKIVGINRSSGHYRPSMEEFTNVLNELEESGIRLDQLTIERAVDP